MIYFLGKTKNILFKLFQQGGYIMNKKALVTILTISCGFILYNLLKKFSIQQANKIIPSSSVFSAIKNTQNSYKKI